MADRRGPKGPRNKVRQVVLVDGHPDCIFETKNRVSITIKHRLNDRELVIKLGNIGPEKVDGLKQIQGIEVIEELKPSRRSKRLPSVIAVKTTKTSTQLTVVAVDQEALDKAVGNIANYLSENGSDIHERCQWVCKLDKGKPAGTVQPEPTPVQASNTSVQKSYRLESEIESMYKEKEELGSPSVQAAEPTVKDRIMNYLKNRSSFNVREISRDLDIPEKTAREALIDMKFITGGTRKSHEIEAVKTVQKGRCGTVTETEYATG